MYKIDDFRNEIIKISSLFISRIASECREGFEYDRGRNQNDQPGFPIFDTADAMFYKSKYQEGFLEWQIRDLLVNELLNFLFINHGYDIRWRLKNSRMTTGGFRNRENEEKFPIEFFLVINGEYIAYRYTPFSADYSISLNLPQDLQFSYWHTGMKQISKWVSIYWTDKNREEVIRENRLGKVVKKEEPFQTRITIKDLFEEFFSQEEYELFVSGIKNAVSQANNLMGFKTTHRLVPSNIAIFREEVLEELVNLDFSSMKYYMVDEKGEIEAKTTNPQFLAEDNNLMVKNFKAQSRYFALAGAEKYAQSFITSEYLIQIINKDTAFDFTSVISGYIKSVEQLCAYIVYDILVKKADPLLYIKTRALYPDEENLLKSNGDLKKVWQGKNKKKYLYYVSMKAENQKFFDYKLTMGQLFYFFHVNREKVFSIHSEKSEPIIFECMQNYFSFDRNGYFHKHNITDYNVVERIKNNTILILYWLLGATVLTGDNESDLKKLGVIDTSFDRLFKKIAYRHNYRYVIKLKGEPEHKAIRLFTNNAYNFDTSGYLQGAELRFYKVDEYPESYVAYRTLVDSLLPNIPSIIIDREHLPEKMYMLDKEGIVEELLY